VSSQTLQNEQYIIERGARGGVVVKALRYKPVAGSIADGVVGNFQ